MPASREAIYSEHNEEVRQNLEAINQANIEIDSLKKQAETAKLAQQKAEESYAALANDNGDVISQYQKLVQVLQAYQNQDMRTAAVLYTDMDLSVLNDGVLNDIVAWVQQDMAANGYQVLEQMGDEASGQENGAAQAVEYYQKSLLIKPDNTAVIFKIGMVYQTQGDTDQANEYFGQIIMNYPDSEYAAQAKEQRGY